jgi:hypothetical protein
MFSGFRANCYTCREPDERSHCIPIGNDTPLRIAIDGQFSSISPNRHMRVQYEASIVSLVSFCA